MTKLYYWIILFSILIPMLTSLVPNNTFIHPIIMGSMLFIITILSSMNLSICLENNWFSFLMFLILIGGLMILFLYFISFNNNMKMTFKWTILIMSPLKILFSILFITLMIYKIYDMFWMPQNKEILPFNMNKMNFNLMYMYLNKKNFPSLIAMMYLLLTLTLIVKLCMNKKIKLRKINSEKTLF